MKQTYISPETKAMKVNASPMLGNSMKLDNTNTKGFGESLGKEGMTPVSEDNASSIWED
jgi:hypothetical protein